MAKSLIPEIARMLGVELGEEFKIKGDNETYRFTNDGLVFNQMDGFGLESTVAAKAKLDSLLNGKDEIVKLPWQPKEGESFYTFTAAYGEWSVSLDMWAEEPCNYALLDKGWIYRTKKEAIAALPAVLKELRERRKS